MTNREAFESAADRFSYCPETGLFHYLPRPREAFVDDRQCNIYKAKWEGKVAGGVGRNGYVYIFVNGYGVLAHRAAWFLTYGKWPENEIDHINGCPTDNRLANLRDVTSRLNKMNARLRSNNKSGVTGVNYDKRRKKWVASLRYGPLQRSLRFNSFQEAVEARLAAQRALPFGPNHGARS